MAVFWCLAIWGLPGGSAQAQQPQSGEGEYLASPLATSQPFELESPVERASFNLRRPNLRALYDALAAAYRVPLVFDRELLSYPLTSDFRIENAPLKEALEAAGSISRTFVAPLNPRTGVVAADTPAKRAEYERQILGSFHVDNQLTPQQLTEISNALRNIVDLRRVTQDTRTNWITVVGRARQIAVAQQFVRTLDRSLGETMLEIHVWEISSRRARQLGILPPQPFALRFLGSSDTNPRVPLSQLGQLANFYGVQLAGLTALLNSSSSLVRSHQVFHVRASDGQEARFLAGEKFPIITTLVSSAILEDDDTPGEPGSSEGFIPGIQYQDIGVVVQATPHFHAGREMTLQLDFALRAFGAEADNGLPSFTNRQLTSQIRLREGEEYLVGGILSNSSVGGRTGYPWLSSIPLLGRLFSTSSRQTEETEMLILIKPLAVRLPAAEFASRAIYFGKELAGLPAPVAPPAEPQEGQPLQPGQPGVPPPGGFPVQPGVPQPGVPLGVQPGIQPGTPVQPGVVPGGAFPLGVPLPPGIVPQQQPSQPLDSPEAP